MNCFKDLVNKEDRLAIGLLTLIYFFITFLYLINWGIYWDDWWLTSLSDSDMLEMFRQTGLSVLGNLHLLFRQSLYPLASYRISLFLCGYITLISVYHILQKEILKNKYFAFWSASFFIAIPLCFAKITLICFPYITCTTFFYLAFALMLSVKKQISFRLLAHLLFFLSFLITSLVSFYSFFLLVLFWQETELGNSLKFKKLYFFLKSNWDFVILPIFFLFLKFLILPRPYGEYAGYNSLSFSLKVLPETLLAFYTVLKSLFWYTSFSNYFLYIASLCTFILGIVLFRMKTFYLDRNSFLLKEDEFLKIIIIFFITVMFAIVPYILVGRTGIGFGEEWRDRDTLLLPLGISLFSTILTLYVLSSQYLINNNRLRSFLAIICPLILFFIFSLSTIKSQMQLLKDTIKQDAILSFMKSETGVYKNNTFVFEDKFPQSNIYIRSYRSYELNGMAQRVFGNQKRFFITTGNLKDTCPEKSKTGSICKDWKSGETEKHLSIEQAPNKNLTPSKVLRLASLRFFNRNQYDKEIIIYFLFKLL